ncbi:MAG: hypothetical protein MZW92_38130 [Comamonadaceae bacterium]|nr:hypothetical protein [Comamonadaceae bacterium]
MRYFHEGRELRDAEPAAAAGRGGEPRDSPDAGSRYGCPAAGPGSPRSPARRCTMRRPTSSAASP